jgi:hypothetical protein
MKGGPPGFLSSLNAHKIYFCIKDRADEVADFKRQRLDSLAELTNTAEKRARTKSEAIRDISSSSINEFVSQILEREFVVFDEEDKENVEVEDAHTSNLKKIDEEMIDSSKHPKNKKSSGNRDKE